MVNSNEIHQLNDQVGMTNIVKCFAYPSEKFN